VNWLSALHRRVLQSSGRMSLRASSTVAMVLLVGLVVPLVFVIPRTAAQPASVDPGVGVLGDSNSDEYRTDDCRGCGTPVEATTLNWVELLARYRGVNFGPVGTWGAPRRAGYEYNWALSGATAHDLIADGQHTGLAQQVAQGLVSTVVISVGANNYNDWNDSYESIYSGELTGSALTDYETTIVDDITLAMDTVQSVGAAQIIWNPIPDMSADAYLQRAFPRAGQRQRVTDSYTRVNARLGVNAEARGIAVVNVAGETEYALAHITHQGQYLIDGRTLDIADECWSPNCIIMPDHHVGTVGQGIYANFYFLQPLGLAAFTDRELIVNAGFS
jgi:hypothetical protein